MFMGKIKPINFFKNLENKILTGICHFRDWVARTGPPGLYIRVQGSLPPHKVGLMPENDNNLIGYCYELRGKSRKIYIFMIFR